MSTLLLALCSILISVLAQFTLKAGMSQETVKQAMLFVPAPAAIWTVLTDWRVLAGFVLYGCGAVVWLGVLAKWDVSKAYPLVGAGFVFSLAIGMLLGENITALRVAGTVLICTGVFLVSRS